VVGASRSRGRRRPSHDRGPRRRGGRALARHPRLRARPRAHRGAGGRAARRVRRRRAPRRGAPGAEGAARAAAAGLPPLPRPGGRPGRLLPGRGRVGARTWLDAGGDQPHRDERERARPRPDPGRGRARERGSADPARPDRASGAGNGGRCAREPADRRDGRRGRGQSVRGPEADEVRHPPREPRPRGSDRRPAPTHDRHGARPRRRRLPHRRPASVRRDGSARGRYGPSPARLGPSRGRGQHGRRPRGAGPARRRAARSHGVGRHPRRAAGTAPCSGRHRARRLPDEGVRRAPRRGRHGGGSRRYEVRGSGHRLERDGRALRVPGEPSAGALPRRGRGPRGHRDRERQHQRGRRPVRRGCPAARCARGRHRGGAERRQLQRLHDERALLREAAGTVFFEDRV
jgi:hypothetical protein